MKTGENPRSDEKYGKPNKPLNGIHTSKLRFIDIKSDVSMMLATDFLPILAT